ncbi:MAG: hypothetical protein ABI874_06845 [Chloroflexota bacterium]
MSQNPKAVDERAQLNADDRGVVAGGDISGTVLTGDIQGDVAVGRNIIQIGNLNMPLIPVLLVIALVAALGVGAYWWFAVPSKMSGGFKVAVAQVGRVDANGNAQASDDGSKLSQFVFESLKSEFDSLAANSQIAQDFRPTIWHDSMNLFQKKTTIGMIPRDPALQAQALKELARRIDADVIIFGSLEANQNQGSFTPEFYVAGLRFEADELIGDHQLGAPIIIPLPINLDSTGSRLNLSRNVTVRSYALSRFTFGLLYDLFGDHAKAYKTFQDAEPGLTDWDEDQGKEILYYFIGREAISLGTDEKEAKRVFKSVDEALQKAQAAFEKAQQINKDYARAHIGLGNVYYLRAQRGLVADKIDTPEFITATSEAGFALDQFTQAVKGSQQPADAAVNLKAQLSVGSAYRLQGHALVLRAAFSESLPFFEKAVKALEQALPRVEPSQLRLLGQTNQVLGAAYHEEAHALYAQDALAQSKPFYEKARDYYKQCSEVASKGVAVYDVTLQNLKKNACDPSLKAVNDVLKELEGK